MHRLWVCAAFWQGWQGALIFFVALMVGGAGAIVNERRALKRRR